LFSRRVLIFLTLLLLITLTGSLAAAAKPAAQPTDPLEQDANLANSIAKLLGFSVDSDKITSLRQKNYGYGEIALVYSLSHISRQPSWEIINMRDNRLGWGEIAKQVGASLSQGMNGVAKIMKDIKMDDETARLKEQIDKEPKPAKTKEKK
jgi:hypothetical protein